LLFNIFIGAAISDSSPEQGGHYPKMATSQLISILGLSY